VPRDTRLYALRVTPPMPAKPTAEPMGMMAVCKWNEANGREAYKEFPVMRGFLPEFRNETFTVGGTAAKGPGPKSKKKTDEPAPPKAPEASFEVDYLPDAVIVDVRGGERISRDAALPGEILVLDADGNLRAHNELDDVEEFEHCKARVRGGQPGAGSAGGAAESGGF
jgi:hypothetical protein